MKNVILKPFKTKFPTEKVDAYLVISNVPESSEQYTVMESCPHCTEEHVYSFINEPFEQIVDEDNDELINKYHCVCASCKKYFVANIEFQL